MEHRGNRVGGLSGIVIRWAWLLPALVLLAAPGMASADQEDTGRVDTQPAPADEPAPGSMELSLRDAILIALENNLDITVEHFVPLIREAEVMQALGEFDTTAFFATTVQREKSPPTIVFVGGAPQNPSSVTDTFSLGIGLSRKLATGATVELSYQNTRTANPPDPGIQNAAVALEVSQPLLRGAGRTVNLADVRIARNSHRAAVSDFRSAVMDVISDVEQAYWDLVYARGNLKVRRRSLQLAEDLLESNRERVKAGILAPSEIIRAQSSVASQEAAILDAETAVEDASDVLRRLINPPQVALADDVMVVTTDAPDTEYEPMDAKRVIYEALTHRSDLIRRKTELESLGIELSVARNELLPTLDLTVFYRTKGAGRSLDTSFDRYSSFLFDDYGATIEFEVPLERRVAKGSVAKARLERQQALAELKDAEEGVVAEVRQQLRRVEAKHEQIERYRRAYDLADERLLQENEKLLLGTATTLDVLEAQDELTSAERDELQAMVDYCNALVALRRATGVLLDEYVVELIEP